MQIFKHQFCSFFDNNGLQPARGSDFHY